VTAIFTDLSMLQSDPLRQLFQFNLATKYFQNETFCGTSKKTLAMCVNNKQDNS